MKPIEAERFQRLYTWATSHGSTLHPSAEVYNDPVTKFSLRVKPDAGAAELSLPAGQTIVSCALPTTLSYINVLTNAPLNPGQQSQSSASSPPSTPSFPPRFIQETPPHVLGRFFLVQQYLLGPRSFWHPYIATLPQPEHLSSWCLPPFWPGPDADLLEGTNAGTAAAEIRDNVAREHKAARRLLKEAAWEGGWRDYSRLLYNWAFCVFTSRSFRPELVLSEEFRSGIVLPRGCRWDDFSVLQPLFDIANHSPLAGTRWECAAATSSSCHFRSRRGWRPGEQIFNNYGASKTNSELLLGYGFVLPETPELHNDYVHLRKKQARRSVPCGAGAVVDGGAGAGGGDLPQVQSQQQQQQQAPPKDYLISLRGMGDARSLAGRARQVAARGGGGGVEAEEEEVLPAFARFEESLLWDMVQDFAGSNAEYLAALGKILSPPSDAATGAGLTHHELEVHRRVIMRRVFGVSPTGEMKAEGEGEGERERDKLAPLREAIRRTLLDKLLADFEALHDADPDDEWIREVTAADEDGDGGAGLTANQRLGLEYRARCDRVLRAAIGGLDPGVQLDVVM